MGSDGYKDSTKNSWPNCGCEQKCQKLKCLRAGGTQVAKEAAQMRISLVGRKNSPERMTAILKQIMQFPNVTKACLFAGITYPTLRYWIRRSETGQPGDGFDLEFGEEQKRFHEHWTDAHQAGIQMVEDGYMERALSGYYETLHHQGRVAYQIDHDLVNLGFSGPEAYLRDEDGKPIPERIQHQDPEVMLAVLKAWRRDRYGQHESLDVLHRGGVMIITAPAKSSAELEQRAASALAEPIDVEFVEAPDPNEGS